MSIKKDEWCLCGRLEDKNKDWLNASRYEAGISKSQRNKIDGIIFYKDTTEFIKEEPFNDDK